MPRRPYVLQTGMGVDLHGGNDTTAATRAVEAAIRHNSLLFLRDAGLSDRRRLTVEVTIGAPHPDRVRVDTVAAVLPHGEVTVEVEPGGLEVTAHDPDDPTVIAVAAVVVSIESD